MNESKTAIQKRYSTRVLSIELLNPEPPFFTAVKLRGVQKLIAACRPRQRETARPGRLFSNR